MVRTEVFGFDPLLVFAICMLGIIVLAIIILSNKDPLIVLLNGALLVAITLIAGNLFEYDVFGFSKLFQYAIIQLGFSGQTVWVFGYFYLKMVVYQPIIDFVSVVKYIVIVAVLFLTIIKAYGAMRGGWKTLKQDQFKEK